MIRPPNKKWKLLELALNDLRKAERSKKYVVDMNHWYKPNSVCRVCLAGSVMAFSLSVVPDKDAPDREIVPSDLGEAWDMALLGLDSMRFGSFHCVPGVAGELAELAYCKAGNPTYEKDRPKWLRTIRKCVRILKEANV